MAPCKRPLRLLRVDLKRLCSQCHPAKKSQHHDLSAPNEAHLKDLISIHKFHQPDAPNKGECWNKTKALQLFNQQQKLCMLLMVLIHVRGGQPVRAQELFTLTYTNKPNMPRTLFMPEGEVVWKLIYNKVNCSFPLKSNMF